MNLKLRHNDVLELRKGGIKAVTAKLLELNSARLASQKSKLSKELKNPKEHKIIRRSLAQLHTLVTSLKETK